MTSAEIRQTFIDFFVKKHGHTFVPSSPVVPVNDETLLFANAGMNQFKPYFLGVEKAPWPRVANTQKCIRAGGKHNDLDDVGRSRRHHTFFEMLGNWSFGNYFKQGAIEMSWELLTDVLQLDPTRIHVSCFEGDPKNSVPRDTESAEIWKKVGNWERYGLKSEDHIHFFGKDNFWEMGETGPCGPCTEIYCDRTPDKTGGPQVNGEDPRVMEIWNNVFIQYNRDASGKLTTLPAQHVDTGMGLERLCQVLQGKTDNYATDLFTPLFAALTKLTGIQYTGKFPATNVADPVAEAADAQLRHDIAFRVIADHVRCLTFALTDGAVPSNEGRGYVLRRILRRAVRFGRQQLNLAEPFLHRLVPVVVETMSNMFPELRNELGKVAEMVKEEEVSFSTTLTRGIAHFEEAAGRAMELRTSTHTTTNYGAEYRTMRVSGMDAFKLYDTYGFPIDLTRIMAEERGITVDLAGFEKLMEEAKERSRGVDKATGNLVYDLPPNILAELVALNVRPTDDSHKYLHKPLRATVAAIWNGSKLEQSIDDSSARANEQLAIILDKTNFYAEMGGQIGDSGEIRADTSATFIVETTRAVGGYVLHIGRLKSGSIHQSNTVTATVLGGRERTQQNHTGTHLANWALREVLGEHVQQKGSLVDAEKLRFDFTQPKPIGDEELAAIENLVNASIEKKLPVYIEEAPQEQAFKINGLRAVFGEKYPPMVRVVSIGAPVAELLREPNNPQWRRYSIEFCGGTHLASSAETGNFVVTEETSVSKGIRRIVALTGEAARQATEQSRLIDSLIEQANSLESSQLPGAIAAIQKALAQPNTPLRAKRRALAAVAELQERHKQHQKTAVVKSGGSNGAAGFEALLANAQTVNGTTLVVANLEEASADDLRNAMDWLKKKHPNGNIAILLAGRQKQSDKDGNALPEKVNLLAAVGDPLIAKLKAGDWIKAVAPIVGGSGGGRPQMAMAGGKDVEKIPEALEAGREFARQKLEWF